MQYPKIKPAHYDGRYGICHKCQSPIEIPGLEAFKCGECGWVKRLTKSESHNGNGGEA